MGMERLLVDLFEV